MTHDLALYLVETLIIQHGNILLGEAVSQNVTMFPDHKAKLLEVLGKDLLLQAAKDLLTPPAERDEIENHPCRNCGGSNCETMLVFTGFKKSEAWFCKDCGHRVVLPEKPNDE